MHGLDITMLGRGFHYCMCGEKFFMSKKLQEHIQQFKRRKRVS